MKTVALNIIVGPGESFELLRAIASATSKPFFDEIVIVNTSKDFEIDNTVNKFKEMYPFIKLVNVGWTSEKYVYGNFSAARNAAIRNTESDYIFWLDADDIIATKSDDGLEKFKKVIDDNDFDYYLVAYHTEIDKETKDIQSMVWRERVFKNRADIGWVKACHEQVTVEANSNIFASVNGLIIEHWPTKIGNGGILRNINIMQHEVDCGRADAHDIFYLARDNYIYGDLEKAMELFNDILKKPGAPDSNRFNAHVLMALHYCYKSDGKGKYYINKDTVEVGERHARAAIEISKSYAEPYVIIGDISMSRNNFDDAIINFKTAMTKKIGNGGMQQIQYYEELPATRLYIIYNEIGDLESALYYNKIALSRCKKDKELINGRIEIINKLYNSIEIG